MLQSTRNHLTVAALVLAAVILAVPGVHLAELRLAHLPAVLITHGLALVALLIAVRVWRARPAAE